MRPRLWESLSVFFISSSTLTNVDGAGFTTHNVVARRATEFERFSDEETKEAFSGLNKYRIDALQGGAPFPDYLYACGDDHDAGEEAHWTPFQQAAATYIREIYPNWIEDGRDSQGAGLVSFMSGVVSHYIVDQNWHGLCDGCNSKGLIKNIGYSDFNCTGDLCSTAHHATDTGGEFVASNQMSLKSWYPKNNWYIPVDDLVNIYVLANQSETKPQFIRECSLVFYVGSWAISTFGDLVYPVISKKLGEFLTGNRYIDHVIGGVDDDSAWTAFMQTRWANWVTYGPPTDCKDCADSTTPTSTTSSSSDALSRLLENRHEDPPFEAKKIWMTSLKQIFADVQNDQEEGLENVSLTHCFEITEVGQYNKSAINIEYKQNSNNIKTDEILLKKIAYSLIYNFLDVVENPKNGGWLTPNEKVELEFLLYKRVDEILNISQIITKNDNQNIDLNINNNNEKEKDKKLSMFKQESLLSGWESHQQFGYSMDTYDIDGDGCMDLLIGSPGFSDSGHPQSGKAEIYFCPEQSASSYSSSSPSNYMKKVEFISYFNETNHEVYERFGGNVKFSHLNNDVYMDVIICSPSWGGEDVQEIVGNYTGYCAFYLGPFDGSNSDSNSDSNSESTASTPSHQFQSHDTATLPPIEPNKVVFGSRSWGVFGEQMIVGDVTGDGIEDIIISAPQAGNDEDVYSNQGEVYVIETSTLFNFNSSSNLNSDLSSDLNSDSVLTTYTVDEVSSYILTSNEPRQHFGFALDVNNKEDLNDSSTSATLLIGAPYYHIDGDNGAVGKVYAYNLNKNDDQNQAHSVENKEQASSASTSSVSPIYTITGCHHASRIGASFTTSPIQSNVNILALSEIGYNSTRTEHNKEIEEKEGESEMDLSSYQSQHQQLRSGRVIFIDLNLLPSQQNNDGGSSFDYTLCGVDNADNTSATSTSTSSESSSLSMQVLPILEIIYPHQALFDFKDTERVVLTKRKLSETRFGYLMKWNQKGSILAIGGPGAMGNKGSLFLYKHDFHHQNNEEEHEEEKNKKKMKTGDNKNNRVNSNLYVIYDDVNYKSYGRFGSIFLWNDLSPLPLNTSSSSLRSAYSLFVNAPRSGLGQVAPDYEEFGEVKLISLLEN